MRKWQLLFLILAVGCEGPVGPQGEQGLQGEPGPRGPSVITKTVTFASASSTIYDVDYVRGSWRDSDITPTVIDEGTILAFARTPFSQDWYALPIRSDGDHVYYYYTIGFVSVVSRTFDGYTYPDPYFVDDYTFKYVIILPEETHRMDDIDVTSHEAIMNALGGAI